MKTGQDLKKLLQTIDHKSYPAYKDTKGIYQFDGYCLSIDHVQGDPFASPSDVSILILGKTAGFPEKSYETKEKRIALQDYLLRAFGKKLSGMNKAAKGSGKSGVVTISRPGQEILDRTACQIDKKTGDIKVRFAIGFPANGRTINSRELLPILYDMLPQFVSETFFYKKYSDKQKAQIESVRKLAEDQTYIRAQLKEFGLVAFVANGAILPRENGSSNRPMKHAIPFVSPKTMEIQMNLPNQGKITGMGIKKGITLIVGGGYHGKSTLLNALELGVYNHIEGDGREFVICEESAVKSRAEDGRPIHEVDISKFITKLPNGRDTTQFSTEDASGSTSQAAGIVEAITGGTKVLLIDEDTSATNFMIRDELMQRVVHKEQEPIVPFIDCVRNLQEQQDISTILVAGSSGAYFYVADYIIQMNEYTAIDITEMAKKEANAYRMENGSRNTAQNAEQKGSETAAGEEQKSTIHTEQDLAKGKKRIPLKNTEFTNPRLKIRTQGMNSISIGYEEIDLRLVEQLTDSEQVNALASLLKYAQLHYMDGKRSLEEVIDALEETIENSGLDKIDTRNLARPRKQEIAACVNRYRGQKFL